MNTKQFGYTPGNSSVPLRHVFAVHIEVDQAGNFVRATARPGTPGALSTVYDTAEELIASFAVYSYRGWELLLYQADHDMRYLIPSLERLVALGYTVNFTLDGQQRIIYAKIGHTKHRWFIRDCSAMLPLDMSAMRSLARCSDTVPVEVVMLGAYRQLANTLRDTFGVRPAVTISTTAVHAFLTTLPEHHVYYRQRPVVEDIARRGYFGGLVWLQSLAEKQDCTYIDCNAMFAHAMRQGVPVMSPTWTDVYFPDYPGIYECDVYCPVGIPFAFVPERDEYNAGVSYPRGKWFNTVLCSTTIELARKHGYTVTTGEGYVFEKIAYPFNDFVSQCQTLELEYKDRGAGAVIKALRTSLYGKFGQRNEGSEYCLNSDTDAMINDGYHQVQTWDGELIDNLWTRPVWIERSHMQPVWAAWITATARNILTEAVLALGPRNCYYGDTDSLIVADTALVAVPGVVTIGTSYGEWKVKEHFIHFRAMARKMYGGLTSDGEFIMVAAGIRKGVLTEADMDKIRPHAPPVSTRVYSETKRAIHTTGGRAHTQDTVKQIAIPELQPNWPGLYDDGELFPGG